MTINIEGVPYTFTDRFTIKEWSQLVQWNFEDSKAWPQILHIATGAPVYYLQQADEEVLGIAIGIVIQTLDRRQPTSHLNFEELTFGQFVDLDVYVTLSIDQHISQILELLEVTTEYSDEAQYVIEQYIKYRTFVYRQYKTLFGLDDSDFTDESKDSVADKMQVARNWYKVIVNLAQNDLTKMDEITDMPLKKVLNFMALQKEYALEEERKRIEQKRHYDLQRNRR